MPIYVDELFRAEPRNEQAKTYGTLWCHLWTDGRPQELHEFAYRLFYPIPQHVVRSWYQEHATLPHYDLAGSKIRQRALALGAHFMSTKERLERAQQERTHL
jgi:hypothetical protein